MRGVRNSPPRLLKMDFREFLAERYWHERPRMCIIQSSAVRGDIAQLGERGVRNAEVGGSSPPISTNSLFSPLPHRPFAPHRGGKFDAEAQRRKGAKKQGITAR